MKDFDFIPNEHHARRTQRKATKLRAGCVSMLIVMMVLWTTAHFRELQSADAMITQLGAQREELTNLLAKKAEMQALHEKLEQHRQRVALLERDESLTVIFSDVSRRMPATVFLTGLRLGSPSVSRWADRVTHEPAVVPTPDQKSADAAAPRPGSVTPEKDAAKAMADDAAGVVPVSVYSQLTLHGVASQTAEIIRFAAALEDSILFARVQMRVKDSVIWGGRRAEEFELICDLAGQERATP
ncbi:hypothetical protein RAS2_01870 [Phycisphaerae bacterium RAS2]|nr:hypothetical protein RAS2_01870 [Phycisphaerae bacterium RAS2]